MITYLNCFNRIKLSLIGKKKFLFLQKNNKNELVLNLLVKNNVVLGYKYVEVKNRKLILTYINNNVPFYNLKTLLKISNPRFLKFKELVKLNNKNTLSNYILSTTSGFLSVKEAINLRKGGVLIFRVN